MPYESMAAGLYAIRSATRALPRVRDVLAVGVLCLGAGLTGSAPAQELRPARSDTSGPIPPTPAEGGVSWGPEQYNPVPAPGDLVLPLPCQGAIAFRRVDVPASDLINDHKFSLGLSNSSTPYMSGRVQVHLAGHFPQRNEDAEIVGFSYYIGKYEVTSGQYNAVMSGNCPEPSIDSAYPATKVSWYDAVDFTRRLTTWMLEHHPTALKVSERVAFFRLPTEVEWEYAARGGRLVPLKNFSARMFPTEGPLTSYVQFADPVSGNELAKIGTLEPNPLGLHDIVGNAAELALDLFRLTGPGRLHGQAGASVVRGGNYLTSKKKISTSLRSEVILFDQNGLNRPVTSGIRPVLVTPVLVSRSRTREISESFDRLTDRASPNPAAEKEQRVLAAVKSIAAQSESDETRQALEAAVSDLQAAVAERDASRRRALRSTIRNNALLADRLRRDTAMRKEIFAKSRKIIEFTGKNRKKLATSESGRMALKRALKQIEASNRDLMELDARIPETLAIYSDNVILVSNEHEIDDVRAELAVVRAELDALGSNIREKVDVFARHVIEYRNNALQSDEDWLRDLVSQ